MLNALGPPRVGSVGRFQNVMNEPAQASPGVCPLCSVTVDNKASQVGIWTGSVKSKASNGPVYALTCSGCGESLVAMATREEANAGTFYWESESEFPGERFVATMVPSGNMQEFLQQIDDLVTHLRSKGFDARRPSYTFAGILVPKAQAVAAREHLKTMHNDYLRVWISDDRGEPETYIGC